MKLKLERRKMLSGYMFILPWFIGLALFMAFPLAKSLQMSFFEITNVATFEMRFIGWDNFQRLLVRDVNFIPHFLTAVRSAVVEVPLILTFSFFIASMVNQNIKGKGFFRSVFFLPVVIGTGIVMEQLLDQGAGAMQAGLGAASGGGTLQGGLVVPDAMLDVLGQGLSGGIGAMLGQLTMIFWKSGIQILLFLSGLQAVPDSLYESAKCDGATPWEMFWKITFPLMTPVLLLTGVFTIIDSFTDIRNGVMTYVKEVAFTNIEMGYAAALGWVYFLFVLATILAIFVFTRRSIVYTGT